MENKISNFLKIRYRYENFSILLISILLHILNVFLFSNINYSIVNYFFTCFFDDLLAPLILFSYINIVLSFYNKKLYSLKNLIIFILLVSLVWEYLIVFIKPTSVSDPFDILFYICGTLIYWIIYKTWIKC